MTTTPTQLPHPDSRCWTRPDLEHAYCPSSTECTALDALELACEADRLATEGRELPELQRAYLDAWNTTCLRELADAWHTCEHTQCPTDPCPHLCDNRPCPLDTALGLA